MARKTFVKTGADFLKSLDQKARNVIYLIASALILLVVTILPVILWRLNLALIARSFDGISHGGVDSQPFEIFSLLITFVLAAYGCLRIQQLKRKNLVSLTSVILPLLVLLQILFVLMGSAYPEGADYYKCYEPAAQALARGASPYALSPPCYIYPPLQAQVHATLFHLVNWSGLGTPGDDRTAWSIVFYLYQCAQFFQILLAFYLTYLIARSLRLNPFAASVLTAALFLGNNPLFRTIQFNQINIWILNCFLLSILWLPRHPFLSGLAIALGAHIKLYNLVLLLPLTLARQWRAWFGTAVGFVTILFLQTGFGRNWSLWQQYVAYFTGNLEKPSHYRNSSVWSLINNFGKAAAKVLDNPDLLKVVPVIVAAINLVILAWFILRILKREKAYQELLQFSGSMEERRWFDIYRLYGHSIDAVALGLLISPSVWEHHPVLAIPIALWGLVTRRFDRPWLTGFSVFLILCLPTFDIFPLGHLRLLGLLLLVWLTAPTPLHKYFLNREKTVWVKQLESYN